jgi:anti-anti-sigma factor
MSRPYQHIVVEREGDVTCVRLRLRHLDELAIHALGNELANLIDEGGCRKIVLSLGPGTIDCLYSVFLAKLVTAQRRLRDLHGGLILCDITPEVMSVFEACKLGSYFRFAPDRASAIAALNPQA